MRSMLAPLIESFNRRAMTLKQLPDPFVMNGSLHRTFNSKNGTVARIVEQRGIGFSADEPIGTQNVGNCVAVIARDPASGKTGLAHYDAFSKSDSLQLFI